MRLSRSAAGEGARSAPWPREGACACRQRRRRPRAHRRPAQTRRPGRARGPHVIVSSKMGRACARAGGGRPRTVMLPSCWTIWATSVALRAFPAWMRSTIVEDTLAFCTSCRRSNAPGNGPESGALVQRGRNKARPVGSERTWRSMRCVRANASAMAKSRFLSRCWNCCMGTASDRMRRCSSGCRELD